MAAASALFVLGTSASAQSTPPNAPGYTFNPQDFPAPGYYRIRSVSANLCLGLKSETFPQVDHFVLKSCANTTDLSLYFAVIPRKKGGLWDYTLRPFVQADEIGPLRYEKTRCLTVARNVVAGVPRADSDRCDFDGRPTDHYGAPEPYHDITWCEAGSVDQRFAIAHPLLDAGVAPSSHIFTLLNARPGTASSASYLKAEGNTAGADAGFPGGHEDRTAEFEFIFDRPLDGAVEQTCLTEWGWH